MLGTLTVLGTDILSMGPQKPTKVKMIVHIIYLGRICKFVLDWMVVFWIRQQLQKWLCINKGVVNLCNTVFWN